MRKSEKENLKVFGIIIVITFIALFIINSNNSIFSIAMLPYGTIGNAPYYDLIPIFASNSSSVIQNSYTQILKTGSLNIGWGFTTDYNNTPLFVDINTPSNLMNYSNRYYEISVYKQTSNTGSVSLFKTYSLNNITQNYVYQINTTNYSIGTYIIFIEVGAGYKNQVFGENMNNYQILLEEQFYIANYTPQLTTYMTSNLYSSYNNTPLIVLTQNNTTIKGQTLNGGSPPYRYYWINGVYKGGSVFNYSITQSQYITININSSLNTYDLIGCDATNTCLVFKPIYFTKKINTFSVVNPITNIVNNTTSSSAPPPFNFSNFFNNIISIIENFFKSL